MIKHSSGSGINTASFEYEQMVELCNEAKAMREVDASVAADAAQKALDIAMRLEAREYQYECGYILGRCLTIQGKLDKANDVLSNTLHIARKYFSFDNKKLAVTTNSIGILCYSRDNCELAINYFLKALQFNVKEEQLKIYNNIANAYTSNNDFEKALEYIELALIEAKEAKDDYMEGALLINTAFPYMELGNMVAAKNNILLSLDIIDKYIKEDNRFSYLKIHALLGMGDILINEERLDQALEHIRQGMNMSEDKSSHMTYCLGLVLMTTIFFKKGEEEKALVYVQKTLTYAEKYQQEREKRDVLNNVIKFYEDKGEFHKAYPFLKQLQEQSKKDVEISRNQNLKKIISEREEEITLLENKNGQIEEQNLLPEQFAHIISHDLKEPIRNIVSFSSLLNKRYYHLLEEDGREFLKYIIKGASTMNQNLIRLLEFTTLKRVTDTDIQQVELSKLVGVLKKEYEKAIAPFEVNINYPDTHFNMVYSHAYALMDEIIGNALKFRKNGRNCYIEISNKIEGDFYHISIKDYGIGIEREYRKQIFKIFSRLNKRDYDGSGVGLAICDRIVSLYHGKIWVESVPDVYTTVHFTLPLYLKAK
jgi:signal transduction histidine kinase